MEKVGAYTDRATETGEWRPGNPATGQQATPLLAEYFNMLQREVVGVVEGAGIELDPEDDGQLLLALQRLQGNMRGYGVYAASAALTVADLGKYLIAKQSGIVLTLPDAAAIPLGSRIYIQAGAAAASLTVTSVNGVFSGTNAAISGSASMELTAGTACEFISGPANWHAVGGSGSAALTPNGHIKHANGLIEQWVAGTSDASGNMSLSLPIQFPNAILGGFANEAAPAGWLSNSVSVWGFDINASTRSVVVARVRYIIGTAGPALSSGISGRVRVWGF